MVDNSFNRRMQMKACILKCCKQIIDDVDSIVMINNIRNINIEFDAPQDGQIVGVKYWYEVDAE
ncbi:MAG: hypothetical protein IJA72_01615 [Clostridia bacterium]|nr:hypothetical protein [Clostridia bacterium]